jgi:septal ring factor EnvC (AmiA/AmiB activator)
MPKMKRTMALFLASLLVTLLLGCGSQDQVPGAMNSPGPGTPTAKPLQDTSLKGKTVVESAMELSEKYARLSDQTLALRQENQRLLSDNEDLKRQIAATEAKLKQTQKELGEANQLLIEMLTELNSWKTNILGFRGEMREASKAELEALLKVLEILSGEAEAGTIGRQHGTTLHPEPSSNQPPGKVPSKDKDQNEP